VLNPPAMPKRWRVPLGRTSDMLGFDMGLL